ncbi:MAG: hypothetical protein ACTSWQ_08690 [Candidatus Thorarchaeota archaeon]
MRIPERDVSLRDEVFASAQENFQQVVEIYDLNSNAIDGLAAIEKIEKEKLYALNKIEQDSIHSSIVSSLSLVRLSRREVAAAIIC